jgi:ribosomal protein S18 acetylase RimI-like enzyme
MAIDSSLAAPSDRTLGSTSYRDEGPTPDHAGGSASVRHVTIIEADLDTPQHQQAIISLIDAYARDPMGCGRGLPPDARERLIPALQQHPTTLVFLALEGATPVGIALCFRGFSTFTARPLLNIHDLAVLPDYRGQGVGHLLLERVEAKGRELGCAKLTLEVRADNHRAQRLYQRFGFGDTPTEDGAVRHWFLQKPL